MVAWPKARMDRLCEVTSSKRIFAADYVSEGVPFYRGKEISEKHHGNMDVSTELFITRSKFDVIRAKFGAPKAGDLLLTSIGALLGLPYVVKRREEFYFKGGNLTWFRNFSGIDSQFLYYWMLSPQGNGELQKSKIGSAQPAFTINLLKQMEIQLPPLVVQRRIAEVLLAHDDLIENNTRRIKILEEMAQRIYREWFVNFRFPGHEKVRFGESSAGPIPSGWTVAVLGDLVSEIIDYRAKTPKKLGADWSENGVLALSALNVKQGRLENMDRAKFVDEELYRRWMKSELDAGDILMTSEAPLGELYFLPERRRYCLSQRIFGVRANPERIRPALLFFALSSHDGQEQIHARASGTTVLGIRQTDLRQIPLLCADSRIQDLANATLHPVLCQIDVLQRKNANLRRSRDLLLPKLISGNVCVDDLEAAPQGV